jgi:hypothetical protein
VGDGYLAVLELPDGRQVLVRRDSVIPNGGRVLLIDAEHLRVALPGRVLDLALDRSLNAPVVPAALGVVEEQSDDGNVMIRRVDAAAFSSSVARSSDPSKVQASRSAKAREAHAAEEAGRRLAPILNLPPDSRIIAVNELPVRSADQAIALIEQSLADGVSPRLNITGAGGESRVYMSPAEP